MDLLFICREATENSVISNVGMAMQAKASGRESAGLPQPPGGTRGAAGLDGAPPTELLAGAPGAGELEETYS